MKIRTIPLHLCLLITYFNKLCPTKLDSKSRSSYSSFSQEVIILRLNGGGDVPKFPKRSREDFYNTFDGISTDETNKYQDLYSSVKIPKLPHQGFSEGFSNKRDPEEESIGEENDYRRLPLPESIKRDLQLRDEGNLKPDWKPK